MIKRLQTVNVGPSAKMTLEFGDRLNLLTGDNGLGKSFLLDIVWWALTRKWPAEVNANLTAGKKALPADKKDATISFAFADQGGALEYESNFIQDEQAWADKLGRPVNFGLVLYAMSDGSFALWDPHRNDWCAQSGVDAQKHVPAYVFSPQEVWDGKPGESRTMLCNGLVQDWAGWQKEDGAPFNQLKRVLDVLSPSAKEKLVPGQLTRISLDDVRDIPTIRMSYQQDVPVLHASSGMRRILALAYFLVWAWEEHKQAAKQRGRQATKQITFLIDEVESHLHPSWQRRVVPALLAVMGELTKKAEVQLIAATHSPLIMASVEPLFDEGKDAWFDLDFERKKVVLRRRDFEKHGNASTWLISEAFDLKSDRAIKYESLIEQACKLLNKPQPKRSDISEMHGKLIQALGPRDEFLFRWRAICHKKGWLDDSRKTSA